jgi:hypothetical protein
MILPTPRSLDSSGARDAVTGERRGGDALVLLRQELRPPLARRVQLVAFVDGGAVEDEASGLLRPDLRWSAGPAV